MTGIDIIRSVGAPFEGGANLGLIQSIADAYDHGVNFRVPGNVNI